MLCTFLMVPMLIGYLDNYRYGLWITLFSMINWFQFFDIGLGNGLRNKYAETLAANDKQLARIYISTAYFLVALIALVLLGLVSASFIFVDWYKAFNVDPSVVKELNLLVLIVFGSQIINFPLKLISSILLGAQQSAVANSFGPIGNVLSLVVIFFLNKFTAGGSSLINVAIVYTGIPTLVYILVTAYYFSTRLKDVRPSLKFLRREYFGSLMGLGVKFFVLQINALILITATPLIIAQILGQQEVTSYNVMFRLYNIPYMIYYIILTPFWNAFTRSYAQQDIKWIKTKITLLIKIFSGLLLVLVVLFLLNKILFHIWVGNKIYPDQSAGLLLCIYTAVMMVLLPFNVFVNGIGKVKLQLYISCPVTILNIPLSYFFGRNLGMGIDGIILANIICIAPLAIGMGIQTYKIVNTKAQGIWLA